jgi:hypothetical protein
MRIAHLHEVIDDEGSGGSGRCGVGGEGSGDPDGEGKYWGETGRGGGGGGGGGGEGEDVEALRSVWHFEPERTSGLCGEGGEGLEVSAEEGSVDGARGERPVDVGRGGGWGAGGERGGERGFGSPRVLDRVQFAWFETGQVYFIVETHLQRPKP